MSVWLAVQLWQKGEVDIEVEGRCDVDGRAVHKSEGSVDMAA